MRITQRRQTSRRPAHTPRLFLITRITDGINGRSSMCHKRSSADRCLQNNAGLMSHTRSTAEIAQPSGVITPMKACLSNIDTAFRGDRGRGPTAFPADAWLTVLKVLSVQPVCFKARLEPLLTHFHDAQCAAVTSDEQQQHRLHLQLEVKLCSGPTPLLAQMDSNSAACQSCIDFSPLPVPVHRAKLELTLMSKQAVLAQQQYGLLQLLLNQQLQPQQPVQFAADVDSTEVDSTELSSASSDSWTITLQIHFTWPSQPSKQPLDYLDLLVTVQTAKAKPQQCQEQQQLPVESSTSAGCAENALVQPEVGLVAEVPLLVLPAIAQQEVQQLLLPAMRQEVQAEQQQEQRLAQKERQQGQEISALPQDSHSLQIVSTVWGHLQQLVNDIYTVMLLVDMLKQPAAEASASSIVAEALAAAAAAAAQHPAEPAAGVAALQAIPVDAAQAAAPLEAAAVPVGLTSQAALASLGKSLLFPVLLPFLAAHGLHNLLQLLVACLPEPLQQQWEQQQEERLRLGDEAAATAQTAVDGDLMYTDKGDVSTASGSRICSSAGEADMTAAQVASSLTLVAQQQLSHDVQVKKQQQEVLQQPSSSSPVMWRQQMQQQDDDDDDEEEKQKGSIKPGAVGGAATAAAAAVQGQYRTAGGGAAPIPFWYSPVVQFDQDVEARYLVWKHYSLIHLDYIGALFAVMYLLALLRRMIREPTTLFYFVYVLLKCMPLAPLVLGFREPFLRYRELWLWLVVPASLLVFIWFTAIQKIATPTTLLPQRAISAYWNGHGELMTSVMRPFVQHMRLRPYLAYTMADAAMVVWVFAQFYGWWAAVGRWGFAAVLSIGLCWGLDLHMRRRFVALQS